MQEPTDNGAPTSAFTMVLSLIVVTVAAVAMVNHIVLAAPSWFSWLPVPSVVCLVPATLRALRGGPPWPAVAALGASAVLVAIHANLPLLGLVLLYEARLDELVRSPTLHSDCHRCECPSIPVGPWSFHGVLSGEQGGTWLRTDCSGDGLIGIDILSTGLAYAPNPEHRTSSAKASAFTEAFARARAQAQQSPASPWALLAPARCAPPSAPPSTAWSISSGPGTPSKQATTIDPTPRPGPVRPPPPTERSTPLADATIAALELPGAGGTLDERLARADAALARAEADVIVLPEAYLPGYAHVRADVAATAQAWMADRARRHRATIVMGYLDDDACVLGVTTPHGAHTRYQKRFLAPAEARVWRAGTAPVIAETPVGRIGLLICADVLQLQAWDAYIGRVDAVAVAAAWPDYAGRIDTVPPALRVPAKWLFEASNPYRRVLLGRAAIAVGATVAYAAATGPMSPHGRPDPIADNLGSNPTSSGPRPHDGSNPTSSEPRPHIASAPPSSRPRPRGPSPTSSSIEQFSGHACIYAPDGRVVATGAIACGPIGRQPPGPPLVHPPAWRAFTAAYRAAARVAPALGT